MNTKTDTKLVIPVEDVRPQMGGIDKRSIAELCRPDHRIVSCRLCVDPCQRCDITRTQRVCQSRRGGPFRAMRLTTPAAAAQSEVSRLPEDARKQRIGNRVTKRAIPNGGRSDTCQPTLTLCINSLRVLHDRSGTILRTQRSPKCVVSVASSHVVMSYVGLNVCSRLVACTGLS